MSKRRRKNPSSLLVTVLAAAGVAGIGYAGYRYVKGNPAVTTALLNSAGVAPIPAAPATTPPAPVLGIP